MCRLEEPAWMKRPVTAEIQQDVEAINKTNRIFERWLRFIYTA